LRLLPRSSLFLPCTRLTLAASISDEDSPMSPHHWSASSCRDLTLDLEMRSPEHPSHGRASPPNLNLWICLWGGHFRRCLIGARIRASAYILEHPMSGGPSFTATWARTSRQVLLCKSLLAKISRY
jgi:hypothetical protein